MIKIEFVPAAATYPLRAKVLKPFLQPHECAVPGDDDPNGFHLAAKLDQRIVGIATFLLERHPDLFTEYSRPMRLRGMATDPEFRRRGIGRDLVLAGIEESQSRGADLLWFNAREKAFAFYEALGFLFASEMFDIDRIGPHKVMYKVLPRR